MAYRTNGGPVDREGSLTRRLPRVGAAVHRWFRRARRRSILIRLLVTKPHRRAEHVVGACSTCGVKFVGPGDRSAQLERVLWAHEELCPGGRREHEVVTPFAWIDP